MNLQKSNTVRVHYFPQDPLVSNLENTAIPAAYVQEGGLVGPRDVIVDKQDNPAAKPDENGNMLYSPNQPQFDQIQLLITSERTLNMWEKYAGHQIGYAFGSSKLTGFPHAGEDFNAYYSRWEQAINFYHKYDDRLGKTIQSAQSYEVVSHEKGHATLDGWKPRFQSWSPDAKGFHESFGDISGMLLSLRDDQVIGKMLMETAGDIRKSNIATKLGEEMSRGIADVILHLPPGLAEKFIIRDAANNLVWSDPATLPENPSDPNQLGRESHNYSRLFTGAVWDILVAIYDRYRKNLTDGWTSARKARDEVGLLVAKMLDFGPDTVASYRQLGKTMLATSAKIIEGRNRQIVANALLKRKILTEDDIKETTIKNNNLPKIKLPEAYKPLKGNGKEVLLAANNLLKANKDLLGLTEKKPPVPVRVVKNKSGESFYHYEWHKEAQLTGNEFKKFNGAFIDIYGSLVFGFDKTGNLMHIENDSITQKRIKSAKEHVKMLINNGEVKYFKPFDMYDTSRDLFKSGGQPYAAYTNYENNGTKMKLEPVPIFT